MPDTTLKPEPSEWVKASPFLTEYLKGGMPLEEAERRARGAQRLKEIYSSKPFYARQAERDLDYWNKFYDSRATL